MGWITADDVRCRLLPAEHAARELKVAAMTASSHQLPHRLTERAAALPPKSAAVVADQRGS